ncbi:uncharacterized protein LOC123313703 [Coccinella septempunctata]|uniref:uncharacterized protein LOC123313703 n=1 Tax=Coccinella septempunctata TaxID=41139 RepID=UPI001D0764FC|nr:uncharacterized protein LOC123313703 [Coccinella septempunctata]
MLKKCAVFLLIFLPMWVKSDENIFVVNSKRPLHVVSERFLSISIDPAVLLTKINLSDVSLQMARHLSPAYVRIAGPSTEFVKYIDTDEKSKETDDSDSVTVTPSVWFAINEWFNMANLTPVFGINDADTSMGVWNPKSILPLLEISDKFNLTCMWQLGYDCSNKTDTQYVEDIRILRHILDAFPDRKSTWKIVGSNIRKCTHRSGCRRLLDSLKGSADYVVWEQTERDHNMLNDELAHIIFGERKNPKLWTSVPRSRNPATFETALEWAKEVGEAGRNGFDVILRTPRVFEFFVDTPVFWFSLLYKTLVGNTVLDIRSATSDSELDAFAYCAKHQNNFIQRGAMVIMIVNRAENVHNTHIRLSSLAKDMEIQSYILTSKSDVRSIYLNGEKLKSSLLQQEPLIFTPKLRRAKPSNGLSISVPPKSIGFFVLPGARVTACMDEEDEMALLMEEIESDQELPLSAELAVEIKTRNLQENAVSLKEMERELQEELEIDEKFYHATKKEETHQKLDDILEDLKENYEQQEDQQAHFRIDEETRKKILERAKLIEAQRKLTESEQRLVDLSRMMHNKSIDKPKHNGVTIRESFEDLETVSKTEKPKVEVVNPPKFTFPKLNSLHQTDAKKFVLGKPKSLHDQFKEILNFPTINSLKHPLHERTNDQIEEFEVPKLNSIHHDDFPHTDHKKLTLTAKNLHEHLKDILANAKTNQLKKHETKEQNVEKSDEIELELTSAEVKKVLADRVKARAAKTNIRFTNEELAEIMKKATQKLRHDHTLKARSSIRSSRLKRDINMKLLNEASKHKLSRKDSDYSEESSEIAPKKKLLDSPSKSLIVNPFYKKPTQRKKSMISKNANMDSSELDDDFDLYFEDDDKEPKKVHLNEKKRKHYKPCSEKKLANMRTAGNDFEEEDDVDKKYMRLDEYFKNAKEVQKFDDIDFSDEDDYSNLDDDRTTRLKRDTTAHGRKANVHPAGCSCSHLVEDIIRSFQIALDSENKEDYESLKRKLQTYDTFMKSMSNDEDSKSKITPKERRSVDCTHHNYRPLCDSYRRWRPEDILSLKPRNIIETKKTVMINDLPLYQHLLRRNMIKRSIGKRKNFLLEDSNESLDSILNRIDKDDGSEAEDDERDYQLVFPNKNKLELKKNKNVTKISFEHRISPTNVSSSSEKDRNKTSEKLEVSGGRKSLLQKDLTNIQIIPKNGNESFFHHTFDHLHSLIHKIGSKIKGYFDDLFK